MFLLSTTVLLLMRQGIVLADSCSQGFRVQTFGKFEFVDRVSFWGNRELRKIQLAASILLLDNFPLNEKKVTTPQTKK